MQGKLLIQAGMKYLMGNTLGWTAFVLAGRHKSLLECLDFQKQKQRYSQ